MHEYAGDKESSTRYPKLPLGVVEVAVRASWVEAGRDMESSIRYLKLPLGVVRVTAGQGRGCRRLGDLSIQVLPRWEREYLGSIVQRGELMGAITMRRR